MGIELVYLHGHEDPELISPDNRNMDFRFMERPHARRVQLNLLLGTARQHQQATNEPE